MLIENPKKRIGELLKTEYKEYYAAIVQSSDNGGKRIDYYETIRQRKYKSIIDISISVSLIMDQTGKIMDAAAITRNITDRVHDSKYARSLIRASFDPLVTISKT